MKRATIITFIAFAISATVFSQGIYFRAGGGYGLPVATTQIGQKFLHQYNAANPDFPNTYSTEIVTGSYGAGTNFQVAFGYKVNPNLILDVSVHYLAGRKFETSDIYSYVDGQFSGTDQEINTTHSSGLFLNPALIFSVGFGKAAPYARFGLVTSSPNLTEKIKTYYDLDGVQTEEITWKYNKGLSIGYQAAAGMNWKLTDRLDLYTEVNFVSMTWYAREGEITEYLSDGVDILSQVPVIVKMVHFKKEFNPQAEQLQDQPRIAPRQASPLSAVSAQAGIRFTIWQIND